jgi:hypothetical protein
VALDLEWPVPGALCICAVGERNPLMGLAINEVSSLSSINGAPIRMWEVMTCRGIMSLPRENIKPAQT